MRGKEQNVTQWGPPVLLGIPFDSNSSYLRGASAAPPLIREALHCDASNRWTETGVDLGKAEAYGDAGDLSLDDTGAFEAIEAAVHDHLQQGRRPLSLGGDHSITFPILSAYGRRFHDLTVIHFDAHPDLYDDYEGNPHSHASPFARIMENKLAKRLIQIGIRTLNPHQRQQAQRFGVELFEMKKMPTFDQLKTWCPVYVSFDLDVLDPAFAPGVSHREPGGMSVREVLTYLHAICGTIVGADIVEYNPARDVSGLTATVAGKLAKEILGKMTLEKNCPEASLKHQGHAMAT
jgi:agmatinase